MSKLFDSTRWLCRALWLSLTLLQIGCVGVRYDVERITDQTRISADPDVAAYYARRDALIEQLVALSPTVDRAEAARLADVALTYPMELAQQYRLTKPAITHNLLVNMGAKPRGLCIDWTEDMLRRLHELNLQSLRLYWGVAYPTKAFRLEHSSPVVTAREGVFDSGVLLDAWRNSGELYFGPVTEDQRYAWERLYNFITDPPPGTNAER
ncbi:MAG: hypothetical protein AB8G17_06915 [Gammaproteobacteria bacterium]